MSPENKTALLSMVERIRSAMKRSGLTAADLTDRLDISSTSLTDWKKSNPSAYVIGQIASEMNVSTDYIILGKESTESLSPSDQAWLDLIHSLPEDVQNDFQGSMRLYLALHGPKGEGREDSLEKMKEAK